jgi:hypothetical protein
MMITENGRIFSEQWSVDEGSGEARGFRKPGHSLIINKCLANKALNYSAILYAQRKNSSTKFTSEPGRPPGVAGRWLRQWMKENQKISK